MPSKCIRACIIVWSVISFRLPSYLLEGLKTEARRQHRSVNNLVEVVLLKSLYNEPNAETLAAMKECLSGVELENFDPNELQPLDLSSFESFMQSLDK